ncbi:MAG: sulfotransferase [Cyanobacteria bacterium P01_H01_bin.15]
MFFNTLINDWQTWANPITLSQNLRWHFPTVISEQPHIFVLGAPRSGTTLVKLIIGVHPRLSGPGYETGIFMQKHWLFQFTRQGALTTQRRSESKDIVEFFDQFAQRKLEEEGGERYIEKTPPHVLRLPFLLKHFPNAQFIHTYRDGRDCYCSARKHQYVKQGRHLQTYAQYWRRCVQTRLNLGEHPRIFDVGYEELVSAPEQVVPTIMNFLGETFTSEQLDASQYSKNRISTSRRPEFAKLSQPISAVSVGRWRKGLSDADSQAFFSIAGSEMQQLGYEL